MPLTRDEFLKRATDCGLVTGDVVAAIVAGLPADALPQDGEQLARELVRQNKLTKFQAEQIYSGRGNSLTLGNYVILDKLGQGGMGMVLKAEHKRMKRIVAIKVMSGAALKSRDAVKRFHREVEAAAKLSHPNIVAAFDADEAGGTHFLVMEYVAGSDLSQIVKQGGPQTVAKALDYMLQAARGLEHAHQQGLVHRDIKPANLLLDQKGTVKILDMGLARFDDALSSSPGPVREGLTTTGTIMGTVDYMSPEQALDTKHADARSDIYSLGISLHYLLAGRVVFEADTIMKKLLAHRDQPIPSLRTIRPEVSPELDAAFQKMIAKNPADRFQTMPEVIAALQACVAGGNGSGGRPSDTVALPPNPSASDTAGDTQFRNFLLGLSDRTTDGRTIDRSDTTNQPGDKPAPATMTEAIPTKGRKPLQRSKPMARILSMKTVGIGIAVVLFLVSLIAVWPRKAVLHVQIAEPQMEVAVQGTAFVARKLGRNDLHIKPGEHTLVVTSGDKTFESESVLLKQGQTLRLTADMVGGRIRLRDGDRVIGPAVPIKAARSTGKTLDSVTAVSEGHAVPNYALEFDGKSSHVEIPTLQRDEPTDFTLEGWIQPRAEAVAIVIRLEGKAASQIYRLENNWGVVLNAGSNTTTNFDSPPGSLIAGETVHVAHVVRAGKSTLFLNGKPVGNSGVPPAAHSTASNRGTWIGAQPAGSGAKLMNFFNGTLREVRISNVARYRKDFTPEVRFTPASETLAMYHFDEGHGDKLIDSSGNNHHGKIVGAKWVRANDALVVSDDPDRRAAEWVLKVGGHVTVKGSDSVIVTDKLPPGRFKVKSVHLSHRDEFVTDNTLKNLRGLTEINELNLMQCKSFTDRSLKLIGTLKTLQTLGLVLTEVTDDGIKDLRGLSELASLSLSGSRVTGRGLEPLRDLQKLRVLEVSDITSSEAVLDIAKGAWPELSRLGLPGTVLTESGVTALANLSTLSRLELVLYQVSDDQLRRLAPLQKLTILWLVIGVPVSDAGLEHLRPLTNLKILGLLKTQVTAAGVAKLQQALPNCKIEWTAAKPVAGGVPATSPVASQARVVDLLSLVDLKRDVLAGEWSREADGLMVKQLQDYKNTPRLQLPYQPPEEYDFEIEFTPKTGNGSVEQLLSAQSRSFSWLMNSVLKAGAKAGFEELDGTSLISRMDGSAMRPKLLENGRTRFRSRVEVRKKSLRGFLNDELLVDWGGTLTRLDITQRNALRDSLHLGLSANDRSVTFHSITVREVSGTGKLLAADSGWLDLFSGKDLTGWERWAWGSDAAKAKLPEVVNEEGRPAIKMRGVVNSYDTLLTTAAVYENYHLRLQYKWTKSNTPLALVRYHRFKEDGGRWCEFYLTTRDSDQPGWNGQLNCFGDRVIDKAALRDGKLVSVTPNQQSLAASEDTQFAVGQWNTLELVCFGGATLHVLNGKVVNVATASRKKDGTAEARGQIELVCKKGDICFRDLELRQIAALPLELGKSEISNRKSQISNSPSPFDILTSPDYEWSAPENLGSVVNSAAGEGSPCLSADGLTLLFDSDRPGGQGKTDLWMSRRPTLIAPWSAPENLGATVNSSENDKVPTLSSDGLTLLFASDRGQSDKRYRLWWCHRKTTAEPWSTPTRQQLEVTVAAGVSDYEPELAADGLSLLFTSFPRVGTHGLEDLWQCRRPTPTDPWGPVQNLGAIVNGPAKDMDPALSSDGRVLLFASDRPGGQGKVDFWWSSRPSLDAPWSAPQNLGKPVNSDVDELSPTLSADGQTLLYRSNRPGGRGGNDLWISRRVMKPSANPH